MDLEQSVTISTSTLKAPKNRNPQKAWADIWKLANDIYQRRGFVKLNVANNLMVQLTAIKQKGLFINNDCTDDIPVIRSEETLQQYVNLLEKTYAPIYFKIQNQEMFAITPKEWDAFERVLDYTEP